MEPCWLGKPHPEQDLIGDRRVRRTRSCGPQWSRVGRWSCAAMQSLDRWLPLQGVGGGASRRDTTRSTELGLRFAFLRACQKTRRDASFFVALHVPFAKKTK